MAKWEISIAGRDEEDLASGTKTKKKGDIVSRKAYPSAGWGRLTRKHYLIVIVDGLTAEQVDDFMGMQYDDETENEQGIITGNIIAKNKCRVAMNRLGSLNMSRIEDMDDDYQPFLDGDISFSLQSVSNVVWDKRINGWRSF